jgi:hypothetical protein
MKGYTTIDEIQNYLLINIDAAFETQIEKWIASMESYIEKQTGRMFIADTVASVRKYDGDGERLLYIDDAVEIEKVEVDGTEIDCFFYPADSLPKTTLVAEDEVFTEGNQNVEVTAKWGYSVDCPEDITFVATVLVAGMIQHSLDHEGEISSLTMGRYSVSYKDEKQLKDLEQAKEILQSYRRYLL